MLILVIIPQCVCISIALYIVNILNPICQLFLNKVGPQEQNKTKKQNKKNIEISRLPGPWEKRIGFSLVPHCHVFEVQMPTVLFNHSMIVKLLREYVQAVWVIMI